MANLVFVSAGDYVTIETREKIDARMKRRANAARYIRDKVNSTAGKILLDYITDKWDETF